MRGRDAKMLVIDYDVGKANLAYSTAEIFTWYISDSDMMSQ
jgi:hypothetical protein